MKRVRTRKDIEAHPYVESIHQEYDGCFDYDKPSYWVYLKTGFTHDGETGSIHEPTIKECCEQLNNARAWTVEEMKIKGYSAEEIIEAVGIQWEVIK